MATKKLRPGPRPLMREPVKLSVLVEAEALKVLDDARWRLRKTKSQIVSDAILEYCQRH